MNCIYCNNIILGKGTKFCNNLCQNKYRTNENLMAWKQGNFIAITGKTMKMKPCIRNFLINQADNKCSKCGWDKIHPITNKVPLEINHIDGNVTNNLPSNLEVICPNCHSLTSNFRALNKNSKRIRNKMEQVEGFEPT